MSVESEDRRNALLITNRLNGLQNNTTPPWGTPGYIREVWSLSDFGFACTVTECIPSRYLRKRALKKLKVMTKSIIVLEQIDKYLANDRKWDSQIADRLAFDLQDVRKRLEVGAA